MVKFLKGGRLEGWKMYDGRCMMEDAKRVIKRHGF